MPRGGRSDDALSHSGLSDVWQNTARACNLSVEQVKKACGAYSALLEALDGALDEEGRLEQLMKLQAEDGKVPRLFYEVDLTEHPRSRPLLLHCAGQGYTSCVAELIRSGFLIPGLKGSHDCNALHLASWGGHVQVVKLLCKHEPGLAEAPNKWKEFPELAAFNRGCEIEIATESGARLTASPVDVLDSMPFFECAEACLRIRVGDESVGLQWFRDQAKEALDKNMQDKAACITIVHGTPPSDIVAAAKKLSAETKLDDLRATGVQLHGQAVQNLLDEMVKWRYLRTLHLRCCGLGGSDLTYICLFLTRLQSPLMKLDLSHNSFRDSISTLFQCGHLFKIKDVNLEATGMSHESLEHLAHELEHQVRTMQGGFTLDTLRMADNDLSEVDVSAKSLKAFMNVLKLANCPLRAVYLDKTRLQLCQLEVLASALPEMSLSTISCHELSIPPEWCQQDGKLYRALGDRRCKVKRFEVDRGQSMAAFDMLWKAIKLRDACASKGKGQQKGVAPPPSAHGAPARDEAAFQVDAQGTMRTFDFTQPFQAHIYSKYWDIRRQQWKVDCVTSHAGLVGSVIVPEDLNGLFRVDDFVEMSAQFVRAPEAVDKDRKARDVVLKRLKVLPASACMPCLESCRLVLVREATKEILLLRSRRSHYAQRILQLSSDIFPLLQMDDELPQKLGPQLRSLVECLSDVELRALIASTQAECFAGPFGNPGRGYIDATAQAKHRALVTKQSWKDLMGMVQHEQDDRGRRRVEVDHRFHRTLTFRVACGLQSGAASSNLMEYEEPLVALRTELHRSGVRASTHRIEPDRGCSSPAALDVTSDNGKLIQRLFLCHIPEEVLTGGDLDLPWLLPTQGSDIRWVAASKPEELAKLLHDERSVGYTSLPAKICELATSSAACRALRVRVV